MQNNQKIQLKSWQWDSDNISREDRLISVIVQGTWIKYYLQNISSWNSSYIPPATHPFLDKKGKEYMLLKRNTYSKYISSTTTVTENELITITRGCRCKHLFYISISSGTYLPSYKTASIKLIRDHWVHHLVK